MDGIIWNNHDKTVFLIDIPGSIAAAQVTKRQRATSHLVSMQPPNMYSNVPEPKKNIQPQMRLLCEEILPYVEDALDQIKTAMQTRPWCEERYCALKKPLGQRKSGSNGERGHLTRNLTSGSGRLFHNPHDHPLELTVTLDINQIDAGEEVKGTKPQHLRIPPKATFLLADCKLGAEFHNAMQEMRDQHDHPKRFDFILMDPPWPNASAKSSGGYATFTYLGNMSDMFDGMDLDVRIAAGGFVGVWVTNNPGVRDFVLGAHGLFERWGVTLVEEWIWLKTTAKGEPVVKLDSSWRRPWECSRGGLPQKDSVVPRTVAGGTDPFLLVYKT